jgi:hypothetical protein
MEQERLKQALDRLIDAQREALDVIAEGLEPDVKGLEEDEQLLASGRLEAALEEVTAILEGAQEDVRGILGAKESHREQRLYPGQGRTWPRRDTRCLAGSYLR